jgi:hypothetical protein
MFADSSSERATCSTIWLGDDFPGARGEVQVVSARSPARISGIPEQHMAEEFSPHRADQPFHEWGDRATRDGLDFVDLQNSKVRPPPVRLSARDHPSADL